jgi:histidine triad (HIT) family protein
MEDCIFCKIVSGTKPEDRVYEDDSTIAFLDIRPRSPGHTLLIPREHYTWFTDMPDELYTKVFKSVKNLAEQMKKEHGADYIRVSIVGREVPHVHIHLIPQWMSKPGMDV